MKYHRLFYLFILITAPFLLWGIFKILPTYDDWNTLSSPNFDSDWTKYFLPIGSFWRPFDAAFGYISAKDYTLFPNLNHFCIFIGHLINTFLIYRITHLLKFNSLACSIATTLFYLSPCTLATVLACDSLNQTYSQLWGLLAVWIYLSIEGRKKYVLMSITIFIAALAKENGLAWAIVPPILAYGFRLIDTKRLWKDFLWGICIALIYAVIRLSLPQNGDYNPDYQTFDLLRRMQEISMLFANTFFAIDIMSIVHQPSRSLLPLGIITIILSLPFILALVRTSNHWVSKEFLSLLICALISVSPNLLLSLSLMNAYASLGMFAIMIGYLVNTMEQTQFIKIAFSLYIISAFIVATHYWHSSWKTSLAGKEMAQEVIRKSKQQATKAYCLQIESNTPKFSSFYVSPKDAFGWGIAVMHETGYQWPQELKDTTVKRNCQPEKIQRIAAKAFHNGYDCVWIVDDAEIQVIEKPDTNR